MTDGNPPPVSYPPPVSFVQLFRYSTRFEIFIDFVGFVAAAAAGSAQPLMTLLFAQLTQGYVSFGSAETAYLQNPNDATVLQEFNSAAQLFRANAAKNASYLVYLGIGALVCTYVYMHIWVYTGEVNAKRIREKYLQAVLRQDIAYFDTVGAGEIATRIQSDTHLVQQSMSQKVALVAYYLTSFVTGYILAFVRCWRLALAVSSILPVMMIIFIAGVPTIKKYAGLDLKYIAEGGTFVEEVISSIRTAHAFGTQKTFGDIYDVRVRAARTARAKIAILNGCTMGAYMFVIFAVYALAFQFGATLINEGYANAGQVVNVVMAILIGSLSISTVPPEILAITNGRAAAAKLFATIERIPAIDSADPGGLKPDQVAGEITLEDVKFNYPSRPDVPIVKGISLSFKAGKTTALVGASGSGKSTIISLIERFYDPLSGSVKLDGIDIRELNIGWLRSQIGLVSQEPTLFAATISGNVAHGLINTPYEHVSEEEKFKLIKEACIKANANDFISKLPNGYETMVGERGFLLSGGQKQRVAIARAIVSDPRILLLDEATSALDTRSEGIVQDALDKAAAGRTTITIAHRLSTVKGADCIYVMGEGLVLEKGTHLELLAHESGAYSRLVSSQKLRETREEEEDDDGADAVIYERMTRVTEKPALPSRPGTTQSIVSSLLQRLSDSRKQKEVDGDKHTMPYLFMRMGLLVGQGLWRYAIGTVFAIMAGMAYPAMSIIFANALAGFSDPNPAVRRYDGNRNALWFFILSVLVGISFGVYHFFFATSAAILTANLRSLIFKTILRQDIEYFDKDENSSGSLTASVSDNPQKINGLAGVTLGTVVQAISTLVGGSIIGLMYAWKLALVGMACIPFLVSTGFIRLHVVVLKDQKNRKAYEDSAQLACEAAASIRTVASLTREDDCVRLYTELLEEPVRRSSKTALWANLLYALSESMTYYVIALMFWYGGLLVSHRVFSTTEFFVTLMSTVMAASQVGTVFSFVPDISAARSAAAAIIKLADSVPEIDAHSIDGRKFEREKVQGQIQFENVHFRYPTRSRVRVLRDLSFRAEPGQYVALVGASGSGKSTVIQLMERFYNPLAGRILLDGVSVHEYNLQEYRKQIALVSQEPTLYAGTIRFNILLGATKPESKVMQEEIEAACRDANILDFIQALPDGFDTQVGGKGAQLSGGQKQRIAIARALLRNPKVLLLDEATSALDSNSEKVVQAALDKAAEGRTTIAIAHRLSTIQNADCIYFIKEGRVSEAGTHDELLSLHGDYYEYVQLQLLSKKRESAA